MDDFENRFKHQVLLNFNASKQQYGQLEQKHDFYGKLTDELIAFLLQTGLVPQGWQDQPLNILDVGCGIGNSTERLQKQFPKARISGLDLSPQMLEAAKERYPGFNFVCGDAEKLLDYFSPATFDLIIYPASLFLLPQQEESLRQAQELLQDRGLVAASVIQGIQEKNNACINSLSGLPGIVKNEKLFISLGKLFSNVCSSLLQIPIQQNLLKDIYSVPALLAGLFPKLPPQERLMQFEGFMDEVQKRNLELFQQWTLIAAKKH